MKRKMKYALLCMGMMLFSMQGMAQSEGSAGPEPKKEHFRETPNPEKTARKEAEHLKKELDLTEKQYKKVYKLLLKEQRELFEKRFQRPEMPGGMPGREVLVLTMEECRLWEVLVLKEKE
jgi:Skp family chaperone for outer membrane proteins